jgi:Interferon regulatory factor transcription factor
MEESDEQVGKGRLRPWLEGLLESGNVDDLRWLDKTKKKFMIPWYHFGRPHWKPEKGQIFKVSKLVFSDSFHFLWW